MIEITRRGVCLILSAPSGAGKTAIAEALLATEPDLRPSVSVTTRARRPTEIEGIHYHFLTEAGFQEALRDNALLEEVDQDVSQEVPEAMQPLSWNTANGNTANSAGDAASRQ